MSDYPRDHAAEERAFLQALGAFAGTGSLCLPITPAPAGDATLFSLVPAAGQPPALQAFTEGSAPPPPLLRLPPAEAALLFFHAHKHGRFAFDPGTAAGLSVGRNEVSLLAGYFLSGRQDSGDLAGAASGEFAAGRLHGAHYLYSLAASRNPASRAGFGAAAAQLELGLLQEAYDRLKNEADPEARLTLASVQRRAGEFQGAADILASIPATPRLDERVALEKAWLDLEAGRDEEAARVFQRLSISSFEKAEPLSGLAAALAKEAFKNKDRGRLAAAVAALRSALSAPSPAMGRIYLQLGNLCFRSGDMAQAEDCYRRGAALAPSLQALANLTLALLKTGKPEEAAAVTLKIALTDTEAAARLTAQFPAGSLATLFPAPAIPQNAPPPPAPAPAEPPPPPPQQPEPPKPPAAPGVRSASLAPADLKPTLTGSMPALSKPTTPAPRPQAAPPPERPQIVTLRDVMDGPAAPTEAESRQDDFISGAFRLASALEDELGRKVYFNIDGLAEAEKKLRVLFIKGKAGQQAKIDLVRECAAFLCYFLQERHKGRLIKLTDFDPWGWPMVFEQPNLKVTTYPIQRVWRLIWSEEVPAPGWLGSYSVWLTERMRAAGPLPAGLEAAKKRVMSHAERLTDTATEHRRMMVLVSSLPETSGIETGRSGLFKLENALHNNFKPDIPPTTDGWKLLRCYGHILAATLMKDFKGYWYNTDGEDGGWAMQLPWKTIVFPLGKVYKAAADRESLVEYYDALLAEKVRLQGGPTGF